jgi:hypothetical protein
MLILSLYGENTVPVYSIFTSTVSTKKHFWHNFSAGLTLMAELGGYLGLILGYSLMNVSGLISILWIKIRLGILNIHVRTVL